MKTTHYISSLIVGIIALAPLEAALLTGLAFPLVSRAGDLTDCNQTGAYAMSDASIHAIGGTFVPVSDSAVTLNTGYLAYKSCVLQPLVAQERIQLTSIYDSATLQKILTGNGGNPYFVQNYSREAFQAGDRAVNATFSAITGALSPTFQNQVATALARSYAQTTQSPQTSLTCPYTGNLSAFYTSGTGLWGGMAASINYPSCNSYGAYTLAQNQLYSNFAAAQNAWQTQLNWGRGIYSISTGPYGTGIVQTPGILVGALAAQALTSGQRQLENANDVGQILLQTFAGMANRVLNGGLGGLASLNTQVAGQPPYLTQLAKETSGGLAAQITSFLLSTLGPKLNVETSYNQVIKGDPTNPTNPSMAGDLLNAINQLRGAENTCWMLIASSTCSSPITYDASGKPTCTASDGGGALHIATSTEFSQPIIDKEITPRADIVKQAASSSDFALQTINTIILEAQNTGDPNAQKDAFAKWDALSTANPPVLHTQSDVNKLSDYERTSFCEFFFGSQKCGTNTNVVGLLPSTFQQWTGDAVDNNPNSPTYQQVIHGAIAWGGSSSTGWCNASNSTTGGPATLKLWIQKWSTP